MSLQVNPVPAVPKGTAEVARAAYAEGNVYMQMRDELDSLYSEEQFASLYSAEGQPALSPWRLALVSIMQFAENLSDRQAAEAVRGRIDWKYALSLELTDTGFHYSVLSEFRARLIAGGMEQGLLDSLLERFKERGWIKARGRQRTDSTHVLGAVKELNQLEIVGETLRHTLNVLATVAPEWLREQVKAEWYERYAERIEDYRLPKDKSEREQLSAIIGNDGYYLLNCIEQARELTWLNQLPAVETLRRVWAQQYRLENGQAKRLTPKDMPPVGEWIRSPYDDEVRYGKKRDFHWVGYKVHLTETCDDNLPRLITQVETVPAIQQDHHALEGIQAQLDASHVLPAQQLVDAGYISAKRILHSQHTHGIDLVGPVHVDPSWQAHTPEALDVSQFQIDWQHQQVTCPQGQTNAAWYLSQDAQGESVVQILFDKQTCRDCPLRARCTTARTTGRSMTLRFPQERHEMLQTARVRQQTDAFKSLYRLRSGIEGTFSQTTRNSGLRRARYIGLRKTHLQCILTAVATNILRLVSWLNEIPFAKTRTSRFAALAT
jgi:transposase